MSFFSLLGGPDLSSDSSSTTGLGKDVIIEYGNTGNSNSHSHSQSYSYSDGDGDDGGYEEEEEEEEGDQIMKMLEEDLYFAQFGSQEYFYQFRERITYCYNQFCRFSPLHLKGNDLLTEGELIGLEYLMDPRRPRLMKERREFPKIYYSLTPSIQAKRVEGLSDTFLVMRSFDYAFSYIIEMALLNQGSQRLPDFLKKERVYQKEERMRLHDRNLCQRKVSSEHSQCPYGWVLYTKSNGNFMKYCTEVQSRNKYIQYNQDEQFLSILPLSFYLVNFLCGPFPGDSMEDYDFWVSVPIYYLDIWESGHPSII